VLVLAGENSRTAEQPNDRTTRKAVDGSCLAGWWLLFGICVWIAGDDMITVVANGSLNKKENETI
jgi:hypothetical protein